MTDRPILFSAPMVRALLAGTKTQTRRVLKPQPDQLIEGQLPEQLRISVGDRLWVREAHAIVGSADPAWVLYRASGYHEECARHGFDQPYPDETKVKWRPSIHMHRWASRITLHVTDVRVQRLQEISAEDAIAEGCKAIRDACYVFDGTDYDKAGLCHSSAVTAYSVLWNSINEDRGFGWHTNPFVAAYTFTVELCNIDQARAAA